MKRIMMMVLICLLILVGCGSNSDNDDSDTNDVSYSVSDNAVGNEDMTSAPVIVEESISGNERYSEITENRFIETSQENTSTFAIDVDTASYSNIRDLLNRGILPDVDTVRIEEMINYFDYDYVQPKDDVPFSVTTMTTDTPWNSETLVTMIGIQGKDIDRGQVPPSNIVMLIDVSGSMQDYNKLPLLKESFEELLLNMTDKDRVSLVVYAGSAGIVLEGAKGSDVDGIMDALNQLQAGGSTAGGEGIELAYRIAMKYYIDGGNNRVVLATDGDFNVGLSTVDALEDYIAEKREEGVSLSVVGFGRGNIRDDIMETLSNKGNGNYAYIDNLTEAKKVFGKEFLGNMFTIAKDVKVQVDFNKEVVETYRLIGYENRVLNNEDFNDDQKDAGELGIGHEVTALYEITLKEDYLASQSKLYDVRLRYKEPEEDISKLVEVVNDYNGYLEYSIINDDFKWALSVTEFGLILRASDYLANAEIQRVLSQAKAIFEVDNSSYKGEFINIIEQYMKIINQ
ncbi:MAG: von Willebrand factor type A domain-containing protein [Clostridiales bacterium]|nr:von Willebrand factor type A domain-containing protein [Clostridiales bacterium]